MLVFFYPGHLGVSHSGVLRKPCTGLLPVGMLQTGFFSLAFFSMVLCGLLACLMQKSVPNAKIGFSKAMSSGWVVMDKSNPAGPLVKRKVQCV